MADGKAGLRSRSGGEIRVAVKPVGPTTEALAAIGVDLMRRKAVSERLSGRARLLYVEAIGDAEKRTRPSAPHRVRATIHDAGNDRTVIVEGSLDGSGALTVTESAVPAAPSSDEFAAAVGVVRRSAEFGDSVKSGALEPYQPIPSVHLHEIGDGRLARRVAVGLLPRARSARHEIVAVDVSRRRLHRFDERAPVDARPRNAGLCGVPRDAGQSTAAKGTAGQAWVTITQNGQTMWRFLVVRPAASSGTNGSGIELRYVDYRGKRVLYRAHVPILNVKYNGDACGPYRDWQYQEGMIRADGVDVAPGFRLCNAPAETILDTGSDTGNFLGVGVYVAGGEVVFVSELEAGWYRYLSEWRFGMDGTIRPRFGFAAVESQCVCNVHNHHVYWRFDFDIETAAHNRVLEYNDPPLFGRSKWHTKQFEIRRDRDSGRARKWRVENTITRAGYDIVPQPNDGAATTMPDWPFGRGDVWILRYHGNEIDDGVVATGPPYEAQIDSWVNGESVSDDDVVVWYGAHFTHDVHESGPAQHGHIVGPDLVPVRW